MDGVSIGYHKREITMSLESHLFTVTRQLQWSTGNKVVEINQGDLDYANPDMLVIQFRKLGEGETFEGMTPAVEAAIAICKEWRKTDKKVMIDLGCTHGMTMPFEGQKLTKKVEKELLERAQEFDEKLEKCEQCGKVLGKVKYGNVEYGEYNCCSEYCAERYWAEQFAEDETEVE